MRTLARFIAGIGAVAAVWAFGSAALGGDPLNGQVKIDGSSTVAPITKAAAELFRAQQPRVNVTVGISGTGGGFKKFLEAKKELRTDISDASRPISPTELSKAAEVGVTFIELPIAYDGIAVVVNPKNTFCDHLTLAELKRIWEPQSTIKNWKDVRPGFPDVPLKLYGPGHDSGTFDYFTEAVVGKEDASRADFTANEDDNVLVRGIEGDAGALGYFGYAYYEPNKAKLKLLAIDNGDGKPVKPTFDTIRSGEYKPLSRPLFLYVNAEAAKRPEVAAFLEFFFTDPKKIVEHPRVNYVAIPSEVYAAARKRIKDGTTGTVYTHQASQTHDLVELYGAAEKK